jgi:hypothetical protein
MEESEENNISQSLSSLKKAIPKPPKGGKKPEEKEENPLVQIYHRIDQKELERLELGHKSELKAESL